MQFLSPYMLWGLFALSVPLLIHLWNGRKGTKVYWAAFRFLEENDNKPIRHIRLEHWLLMALRMFMLLLLTLLMAQLFIKFLDKEEEKEVVHLVEPNADLLSEFKFELAQAIENQEPVFWLNQQLEALEEKDIQTPKPSEIMHLQTALNRLDQDKYNFKIYLSGFENSFDFSAYLIGSQPEIFLSEFSNEYHQRNSLAIDGGRYLFVDNTNNLTFSDDLPVMKNVIQGNFGVEVDVENSKDQRKIQAAFQAVQKVFGLNFEFSGDEKVDILVTENNISENEEILTLSFSNDRSIEQFPNVYGLKPFKSRSHSTLDDLPTEILKSILDFYGIKGESIRLAETQVREKFILKSGQEKYKKPIKPNAEEILWIVFLLVLMGERFIANRSGL
ncbi:BatA domain-containing protein [Indibacter alkaliphilus]|nr:BatA domain-containing protein [Indibacter alkaliphilus]